MIEDAPSITKYTLSTFISHTDKQKDQRYKCDDVTKQVIPTSFFLYAFPYFILDELTPNAETNSHGPVLKDSYLHLGINITQAMGSCETLLRL